MFHIIKTAISFGGLLGFLAVCIYGFQHTAQIIYRWHKAIWDWEADSRAAYYHAHMRRAWPSFRQRYLVSLRKGPAALEQNHPWLIRSTQVLFLLLALLAGLMLCALLGITITGGG